MPAWKRTIYLKDVWRNEELTFEQRRDEIVKRIRESSWLDSSSDPAVLNECLDMLAEAPNTRYFDADFSNIYDLADVDRVWIETR